MGVYSILSILRYIGDNIIWIASVGAAAFVIFNFGKVIFSFIKMIEAIVSMLLWDRIQAQYRYLIRQQQASLDEKEEFSIKCKFYAKTGHNHMRENMEDDVLNLKTKIYEYKMDPIKE